MGGEKKKEVWSVENVKKRGILIFLLKMFGFVQARVYFYTKFKKSCNRVESVDFPAGLRSTLRKGLIMVVFKKLTFANIPTIAGYFSGEERERAIRTLKKFAKDESTDISMAIVDGMMVLRQEASMLYVYSMPTGPGNLRLVLMQLMEAAAAMNYDWLIVGIRQEEKELLRQALPHHFKFSGEEKFSYLDMMRIGRRIVDDSLYVAVPTKDYDESIFYSNEHMVPTVGEFGQTS